ncbi:MAG: NAD(P)-dependent dehydrogenase (short-subunit alcohol dehydrogenase family) [Paraglaciecola sp.]|jgi:NAD(P)-dependent dehydrogenase (short-subunit alcohol dehydrogenase family)
MKILQNKIALVTGAAGGIGRATAEVLAHKGAKVIVTDINEPSGKETVELIQKAGGEAVFYALNVGNKDEIDAVMSKIIETEGRLDLAVNNAGIGGVLTPLHEVKMEDWERMIAINLTGQFLCLQAQIKAMLATGGGSIVNVSSLAGVNGIAYGGPYSAAKHGLVGLTKTAAKEYAKMNIRVNAVCPGFIETPLLDGVPEKVIQFTVQYNTPMKRLGKAIEVGQSIAYLLSEEASFITGTTLYLDGGLKAG